MFICMWKRLAGLRYPRLVQAQVHPPASRCKVPSFSYRPGLFAVDSFALGTGRSPRRKPHVHCMWKRLAGRPTGDPRLVQAQVHPPARAVRSRPFVSAGPFCRGSFALGTGRSPRRKPHVHCMWKRLAGRPTGDPRLVQAQVHPPARAVRSRPFVSAGPFCRGSFALGTGRSPRRKPHVH